LVSGFIIWAALKILLPAINELLESSLPENLENEIVDIIKSHPDVKDCHNLKTRKIGNIYAIDVHVKLDKNITFVHSHDVASEIESKIRNKFGKETIINIHTEPI
jgi:divalent metal cation (Fe/Co/Zn/Cd) transporter